MFGPGCSEECRCVQKNSVECHRRHGACICKPGYRGDSCKDSECKCIIPEQCKYTKFRNPQNKELSLLFCIHNMYNLCTFPLYWCSFSILSFVVMPSAQYFSMICWPSLTIFFLACESGFYGSECVRKCTCPPGVSCDHVTGACQPECSAGKRGEKCDEGKASQNTHLKIWCR